MKIRWDGLAGGRGPVRLLAVSAIALLSYCGAANAELLSAGTFRNLTNQQVGATITSTGSFFNAQAEENAVGDFAAATLTVNGGAPTSLPLSGTQFSISPSFPTQAAMDLAYPFGTYAISLSGGTDGPASVTLNYSADGYTADIPALTLASYDALQGLSTSSSALTLDFNSFTPNALATSAFTFLTIFNSNQSCDFLAPTSTSCTIDPSALTAGMTYDYELDFSDRIEQTVDGVLAYTDFDVRTDGTFTTAAAVPEPASLPMFLTGLGLMGAALYFARKKGKAS